MQIDGIEFSDAHIVKEWFPRYYARMEAEKELAKEEARRERKRRLAVEEAVRKEQEAARKEQEDLAAILRDAIMFECARRSASAPRAELEALVKKIDDNNALCEILRACSRGASFDEIVGELVARQK